MDRPDTITDFVDDLFEGRVGLNEFSYADVHAAAAEKIARYKQAARETKPHRGHLRKHMAGGAIGTALGVAATGGAALPAAVGAAATELLWHGGKRALQIAKRARKLKLDAKKKHPPEQHPPHLNAHAEFLDATIVEFKLNCSRDVLDLALEHLLEGHHKETSVAQYFDKSLMSFASDLAEGKIAVKKLPAAPAIRPVRGDIVVPKEVPGFVVEHTAEAIDERTDKTHRKQVPYDQLTLAQMARHNTGFDKQENPIKNFARRVKQAYKDTRPADAAASDHNIARRGIDRTKAILKRAKDLKYHKQFLNRKRPDQPMVKAPTYDQAAHWFKKKPSQQSETFESYMDAVIAEFSLGGTREQAFALLEEIAALDLENLSEDGFVTLAYFGSKETLSEQMRIDERATADVALRDPRTRDAFGPSAHELSDEDKQRVQQAAVRRTREQRRADAEAAFGPSAADKVSGAVHSAADKFKALFHKEKPKNPKDEADRAKAAALKQQYQKRIAAQLGRDRSPEARKAALKRDINKDVLPHVGYRDQRLKSIKDNVDFEALAGDIVEVVTIHSQLIGDNTYLDTFVNEVCGIDEQTAGGEHPADRIRGIISGFRKGVKTIGRGFSDPAEPDAAPGRRSTADFGADMIKKLRDEVAAAKRELEREREAHSKTRGRFEQIRGAHERDRARSRDEVSFDKEFDRLDAKLDDLNKKLNMRPDATRRQQLLDQIKAVRAEMDRLEQKTHGRR